VADLEEHAIRRDRRFLVRLGVLLLLGALASLWVFGKLTSDETGGCAATLFGGVEPKPAAR
jgi:hypothetical protein